MRLVRSQRVDAQKRIDRTPARHGHRNWDQSEQAPPADIANSEMQDDDANNEAKRAIEGSNICFHGRIGLIAPYSPTALVAAWILAEVHPLLLESESGRRGQLGVCLRDFDVFFRPAAQRDLLGLAENPHDFRRSTENH